MLTEADKKDLKDKLRSFESKEKVFYDKHKEKYKERSQKNTNDAEDAGKYGYLQLGFEFTLSIIIFLFAGHYLDKKISSEPLFLFIGLLTGFAVGLYRLIKVTKE